MADSRDTETQYIEIVNWKRAQPNMPEGPEWKRNIGHGLEPKPQEEVQNH